MLDNDETIFRYLNPMGNDRLSDLNDRDLYKILEYIDRYYLEYRSNLGFDKYDTFGLEIEMEHFYDYSTNGFYEFLLELFELVGNKKWDSRNDRSLRNCVVSSNNKDGIERCEKPVNMSPYLTELTWGKI